MGSSSSVDKSSPDLQSTFAAQSIIPLLEQRYRGLLVSRPWSIFWPHKTWAGRILAVAGLARDVGSILATPKRLPRLENETQNEAGSASIREIAYRYVIGKILILNREIDLESIRPTPLELLFYK
jgi:hypothetical protein